MLERSKSLLMVLVASTALGTTGCKKEESGGEVDMGATAGGSGGGGDDQPIGGGDGGAVVGGGDTPVGGGVEPFGGNNDGGATPGGDGGGGGVGGGEPIGGDGGGAGAGGEMSGGTLRPGEACDPMDDQCVADALCADLGLGKGSVCYSTCTTRTSPSGCDEDTEACLELNGCADDAETCPGICLPTENCTPCNAAEACGGPASCFANLSPASLCLTAGTVDVGGDCLASDADPTLPENNCMDGLACVNGVCRAPCGGAMCGGEDKTCGEGDVCIDISHSLNGTPYDFCAPNCSVGTQMGCEEEQICVPTFDVKVGDNFVWYGVCDAGEPGEKTQGAECAGDNYFGDCTAAYYCADPFGVGKDTCLGFCDQADRSACLGLSVCLIDLFTGLSGVGLCSGECDFFGDGADCGEGNKCDLIGFGLDVAGNDAVGGFCAPRLEGEVRASFEDCTVDMDSGADDCGPAHLCIALEQNAPRICVPVCDGAEGSENGCAEGSTCMTSVFGAAGKENERYGICTPPE